MITKLSPGWFDRLLILLRLSSPWCGPAAHAWSPVYGDAINYVNARWVCVLCPARYGPYSPAPTAAPLPSLTQILIAEYRAKQRAKETL